MPSLPKANLKKSANLKQSVKRVREESDDDMESIGSLKDFIVPDPEDEDDVENDLVLDQQRPAEDNDIELLKKEAVEFAKLDTLQTSVVNGRTLRSRDKSAMDARKPKDLYYERFGKQQEEVLMEKFTKKDIIEYVQKLKEDNCVAYEAARGPWPQLSMKMSLQTIQTEYQNIKDFLGLPDSDDESSDAEEDDADEDDEELDDDAEEDEDLDDAEDEEDAEEDEDADAGDEDEDDADAGEEED